MEKYDFSGWCTKNNLRCSDGRTIMKDAFKDNDGQTVPLVWNHQHNEPYNVLGHALLENRDEGVYAYCTFNDTENGQIARVLVQHGDISALSIYANQLKQQSGNVMHGMIREVSLVHAGANPAAFIEHVIRHSDDGEPIVEENEGILYTGENISLYHADTKNTKEDDEMVEEKKSESKPSDEKKMEEKKPEETKANEPKAEEKTEEKKDKTIQEVVDSMTEEQKTVLYALVGQALEEGKNSDDIDDEDDEENDKNTAKHSGINEGGNEIMKNNVFDTNTTQETGVLCHADQEAILDLAKSSSVGSFRTALNIYAEDHKNTLAHGIDDISKLFPDYKDIQPGAPELVERDKDWVGLVMRKARKTPASRVRTRQADAIASNLKAKGYKNRSEEKKLTENLKLIMRTTDPQTVYVKDELHRDDIMDITDFDVVAYQKAVMKNNLEETVALAALVGDGREDTDPDKIHEAHIRPIWTDSDVYTIHYDVDVAGARAELQGTNTAANFSDNYVYSEAIISAALYSREQYRGKGQLDFFCAPHLLNVMLLARDLNGRRIYDSKDDLAKALNVGEIHTVEQFEGLTRTDSEGHKKKLLGIFVNMANYQFGCAKGGEITDFEDFDIDFNKYKYLMETRLSGALIEAYSAIALEEPVSAGAEAAG